MNSIPKIMAITLFILLMGLMLPPPSQAQGGDFRFAKGFGGAGDDFGYSLTVDNDGYVYVTGTFKGSDILLAKYSADGNQVWSKRFEAGSAVSHIVTVDKDGNVYITGLFNGTINFGGKDLINDDYLDSYLVSYTSDGTHRWSKRLGATGTVFSHGVSVDDNENLYITGYFQDIVDFGNGSDIFLASYTVNGNHRWSKRFEESEAGGSGYSVGIDGAGNIYLLGRFNDPIVNFGGDDLTGSGIMLVSFDTNGTHRWSKGFGDGNAMNIIVDETSNLYMTGYFQNTIDLGGENLTSAGSSDIFLASYTVNGDYRWSKRFGGVGDDYGGNIAIADDGNLYMTGYFQNTIDFGGGDLISAGGYDIFLASYTIDGTHRWSKRFGGTGHDEGTSVDGNDKLYMTGAFENTADFGGGNLTSAGESDIFLASYEVYNVATPTSTKTATPSVTPTGTRPFVAIEQVTLHLTGDQTITIQISPTNATQPITYHWLVWGNGTLLFDSANPNRAEPQFSLSDGDSVLTAWGLAQGEYTINVSASNGGSAISSPLNVVADEQGRLSLKSNVETNYIYLPLIMR
ncbi:SBBP repeat-containing protein [Anaerolineales bacterium HSG6]|nr:SBBP repeat-containing protein [Anaerolineales bacterium HSG6]